ncbi:hypothetical protein J1N35_007779 [Gossypium stocksii]|uniref:Uncharacterized protein n=1 Tax=Gossypium stocksii TaxID=47602 RepID=A0A9D3W7W3_9ROSI|nr:hypothetical protein J1N35_007779 [Gossypium stocksii]
MLWGGSSYTKGSSTHMGYRTIDELLFRTEAGKGTSNTVLEGEEERVVDANDGEEPELEPIRKCGLDGLRVALFFKSNSVKTKLKPCEYDDDTLDSALNPN